MNAGGSEILQKTTLMTTVYSGLNLLREEGQRVPRRGGNDERAVDTESAALAKGLDSSQESRIASELRSPVAQGSDGPVLQRPV